MERDVAEIYGLPRYIEFCKKCTMSNQRPRISINSAGICSACEFSEYKRKGIDWDIREGELVRLCDKFRKDNGEYRKDY